MTDERRFRLDEARETADALLDALAGTMVQAQVAGSIRRMRSWVHDIDLVIEPRFEGRRANLLGEMVDVSLLDERLTAMSMAGQLSLTKNGPKVKAGRFRDIPFDIFVATAETWPITLLIRTGSALHNIWLCTLARDKRMLLKADGSGLFRSVRCNACGGVGCARCAGVGLVAGQEMEVKAEDDVFKALGMGYVPPQMREREQPGQQRREPRRSRVTEDYEVY